MRFDSLIIHCDGKKFGLLLRYKFWLANDGFECEFGSLLLHDNFGSLIVCYYVIFRSMMIHSLMELSPS
jgi:hypothetical protein